jgi:hypothetical protein
MVSKNNVYTICPHYIFSESAVGRTYSMQTGEMRNAYNIFVGKPERMGHMREGNIKLRVTKE